MDRRRLNPGLPGAKWSITVKLTYRQKRALEGLDAPASQWIRQAVEERLRREMPGYGDGE